jgi:hypothetical protein
MSSERSKAGKNDLFGKNDKPLRYAGGWQPEG